MEDKKHIPYSASGNKEEDEIILEPFSYIQQVPGKGIKSKIMPAFNYWFNIPQDKLLAIGEIGQLLFACAVLLDDMEDNSRLRMGIPVAHNIYGLPSVINASGYGIMIALEKVIALNHPESTQVYLEELLELHRGQGMDIYWRDNRICPSETAYKQMTFGKSGGLLNLAARLMQLFSNRKEDFTSLTRILGYYLQVLDDYCDTFLQEDTENKSFFEDLSEGSFSFPIMHAIRTHPEDRQLMNMLRQRTKDIHVKRYCINLLVKFGSLAYTERVLEELDKQARNEIERLGGNPLLMNVLDEILLSTQDKKNASMLKMKTES